MAYLTRHPGPERGDELWVLSHKPVFTLGQAGKPEHVLDPGPIPVLAVDRGGQVTYHGPGQLVVYLLLDVRRRRLGVRQLVDLIESSVIATLAGLSIVATSRPGAPGVYVDGAKIAALGLRIRNGRSYHGLSLNVDMDLAPFARINPCGFQGLAVTQVADQLAGRVHKPAALQQRVTDALLDELLGRLGCQTPTD
jgi:lipoyl(octanoyl) transferase